MNSISTHDVQNQIYRELKAASKFLLTHHICREIDDKTIKNKAI